MKNINFYIKNERMKEYDNTLLEITSLKDIIVAKIQLLLFTNKGEVLGDPNFGCDIPKLLWQTNLKAELIEEEINEQIRIYIPELINYNYTLLFYILPGTIQDIGIIDINLDFTNITALFK